MFDVEQATTDGLDWCADFQTPKPNTQNHNMKD
jgi:hypothetical protein